MEIPANPYESEPQFNSLRRGLRAAIPCAAIGFSIPIGLGYGQEFIAYVNSPFYESRIASFTEVMGFYGIAAFGCALVFFLAAMLSYTPAEQMGFVRAILYAGLYALIGVFILGFIAGAFGFDYRKSEGSSWWDWFSIMLPMLFPIVCTAIHIWVACAYSKQDGI